VTVCLAGTGRQGADATERSEGSLRANPLRIVPGCRQQDGGSIDSHAAGLSLPGTHGLGQGIHVGQKLKDLLLKSLDTASQDAEHPLLLRRSSAAWAAAVGPWSGPGRRAAQVVIMALRRKGSRRSRSGAGEVTRIVLIW